MAALIDEPRWPARGISYAHLVSDASLEELHDVAYRAGIDPRAFDHDHYDVPAHLVAAAVEAGARRVPESELIRRLVSSGLRVRPAQKTPTRESAIRSACADWARTGLPESIRDELLTRWSEPHRHYHDVRHLAQVLTALGTLGCGDAAVVLAAWFHDAIYDGVAGRDEERSAQLAEHMLSGHPAAAEVALLVRMTATHAPRNPRAAALSDADLSILGQIPGRYHVYLRDVRLDYAHVSDEAWRAGRSAIVETLLSREPLFHTGMGRALWQDAARRNLARERDWLASRDQE